MQISACIITRDDPHLARAVESIRPGVDEVVIVDTGSAPEMQAEARRLADTYELFTACNDWQAIHGWAPEGTEGQIASFSVARRRSFELASHEAAVWVDSDDVVEGAEHLRRALDLAIAEAGSRAARAQFAYEYEYDARGNCVRRQVRERLVYPKSAFHWIRPVHEALIAIDHPNSLTVQPDVPIVWKHVGMMGKRRDPRRNLRILRAHARKQGAIIDIKTRFDLGMECIAAGDHVEAEHHLASYVRDSEWDDERFLACLLLCDMFTFYPGRENSAAHWAHMAIDIKPEWPDGYWALAKIAHWQASRHPANERKHLARLVHYGRKGFGKPPADTPIPLNPVERTFNVPWLLQDACGRLGQNLEAIPWGAICAINRPDPSVLLALEDQRRAAGLADDRLDIVISCGHTMESWDPVTAKQKGIGGSETAVIEMAKRLVAQGARVQVFCRCDNPGVYDGVEYRTLSEQDHVKRCDVLIAWRNAIMVDFTPATSKWIWAHDTEIFNANPWSLHLTDRILAVSEWHAEHLRKTYPEHAHKVLATRNGIDLTRFDGSAPTRNPHKAIFSSSPDRGLEPLLELWPRVRAEVPDAELHVFYGFTYFDPKYQLGMLDKMAACEGVVFHGRVDQQTLADEMRSAGVWVHPSWTGDKPFTETSCIGAMEAHAAGMFSVVGNSGALPETSCWAELIDGDARSQEFQQDFAAAVVWLMKLQGLEALETGTRHYLQSEARKSFDWDGVADQWMPIARKDGVRPEPALIRQGSRPILHLVLAPLASGGVVMDANNPGGEAMGGGSRLGFLGLVREMGKRGEFRIRAFSTFKDPLVCRDGVEYIRLDRLRQYHQPDVLFAFYDTSPLETAGPGVLRIASHHTYQPYMHFDVADINTAPSQPSLEFLRDRYDATTPWHVLPNGCDAPTFERTPVFGRIIYHTSAERGLHLLLEAYPAIRARVPDATLHIVGPVQEVIDTASKCGERMRVLGLRMAAALERAQALGGIKLLGRLPRSELDRELAEASVFAFPCSPISPCETFSLSIMECCALGLPVVLCPADSLESIYKDHVLMVPPPASEAVGPFAECVADVLTDPALAAELSESGRRLASQYTFEREAEALTEIIRSHTHRLAMAAE